jgi:hypothetical protein
MDRGDPDLPLVAEMLAFVARRRRILVKHLDALGPIWNCVRNAWVAGTLVCQIRPPELESWIEAMLNDHGQDPLR